MAASEGERFVRAFHEARPAATSSAYARGDAGGGRSSYARLAARAAPGDRVLDLACGDGALLDELVAGGVAGAIGVDVAGAELARARRRGHAVVQGRAQALPLAAGAVDVALCHLAMMLFDDAERVAAELARVLAPGGRIAAVVGGGPTATGDDAFHRYAALLQPRLAAAGPAPRLGDARARDEAGWRSLLGPRGFAVAPFERWEVELGGTFDQVWATLSSAYAQAWIDPAGLREALAAEVAPLADAAGRIPCRMVVWLAEARRGGG